MKKIIAIDIGNTETTVGIGNKDGWDSYRFTTRDANTSDELLALFNSTFNRKSPTPGDRTSKNGTRFRSADPSRQHF